MTKTLRAADLGYVWLESIPDGRAFTRDEDMEVRLHRHRTNPRLNDWKLDPGWLSEHECETAGIPIPDFGDRHWTECILVKGDEPPELPPRPPGKGWVDWSGGECPVSLDADVVVQFGYGDVSRISKANLWCWRWDEQTVQGGYHIIRYRVVEPPKPKLRPYKAEELEALVGKPLRCVEDKDVCLVERARRMKVFVAGLWYGTDEMLQDWTHLDGRPCGEEVTGG